MQGLLVTGGRLNLAAALDNPQPPPPPPPPGSLPIIEDFEDNQAQFLDARSGNWSVTGKHYHVDSPVDDDNVASVATLRLDAPLPDDFELQANVNAENGRLEFIGIVLRDVLSNGFLVFDYHSQQDFKFAGADVDQGRWVIGHRDASGWAVDSWLGASLSPGTNYPLKLVVQNTNEVALFAGGQQVLAHTFVGPVTDGDAGVGARNSSTNFDNIVARAYQSPAPGTLPLDDDFDDGVGEHLVERIGIAGIRDGRLELTPIAIGDSISTVWLDATLPANVDVQAVLNADDASPGRQSNGFVIFDYQDATDFKFAGAFVGIDQWVVGRRTPADWVTDAVVDAPIHALTDYDLRVTLAADGTATLLVDGLERVSYQYGDLLTDGDVGLGVKNAVSRFDQLSVTTYTPPPLTSLPFFEDFSDGAADFLDSRTGVWTVAAERYGVVPILGADGVSTVRLDSLPADFEVLGTINMDPASAGRLSNAFVILDYQDAQDFKFAGAYAGSDQWIIGHRDNNGWIIDAAIDAPIDTLTDYQLRVTVVDDLDVALFVNGVPKLTHRFEDSLRDGEVGIGTRESIARFDSVEIQDQGGQDPTPTTLPFWEDFQDSVANHLLVRSGLAGVGEARYHVTPHADGDGLTTVVLSDPLPANVSWEATFNADAASPERLSNAFLIFDYVSPQNFKFAGSFVGIDQWLIGHRNAADWITDAYVDASIDALADYDLQVILEASGQATLYVDGARQVTHNFGQALTGGELGLGTKNAVARFDNLAASEYVPPPTTSLPYGEDFSDGTADFFAPRSGAWTVTSEKYAAVPVPGADGVSTVRTNSLPDDFELLATINADAGVAGRLSNAFIIFDYQDATNFKFAGAYTGSDQWLIGHRDAGGWQTDAWVSAVIDAVSDYDLRVTVTADAEVTLYADGVPRVSHAFAGSIKDGGVGVGTRDSISRFDDVAIREVNTSTPPPGSLPLFEDFEDGVADHLQIRSGLAGVGNGGYQIVPQPNGDGITTAVLSDPLSANVEFEATFNADGASSGRLSNAFLIFDYVSATDFKFAGAYVGIDQWLIGHRNASGWVTDAFVDGSIDAQTDYALRVTLESDGTATLFVGNEEHLWFSFGESLTNGEIGIGTTNALARFDDVAARTFPNVPLPYNEDFNSGDAEFLLPRRGDWNIIAGRYEVVPTLDQDGLSTIRTQPLPQNFEIEATIHADPAAFGRLTNAFVIFDYHGPSNFNFAGGYVGSDQWIIGHRDASGWVVDASVSQPIEVLTDYDLRVRITNDTQVVFSVDGVTQVTHTYGDSLRDGDVGIGTRNGISRFDDIAVRSLSTPQAQLFSGSQVDPRVDARLIAMIAPFYGEDQHRVASPLVNSLSGGLSDEQEADRGPVTARETDHTVFAWDPALRTDVFVAASDWRSEGSPECGRLTPWMITADSATTPTLVGWPARVASTEVLQRDPTLAAVAARDQAWGTWAVTDALEDVFGLPGDR